MITTILTLLAYVLLAIIIVKNAYLYILPSFVESPKLFYNRESDRTVKIVDRCGILHQKYSANPIFGFSGVLHSLVGIVLPIAPAIEYRKEPIITEDGGTMRLDWFDAPINDPETTTILILPGFEGGSESSYIRRFVFAAYQNKFRTVVLNYRGYADLPVTSGMYHSIADTKDLDFALKKIKGIIPNAPLIAAGFSMGSNNLIKYLSQVGSYTPFIAAISAGNPYDLLGLAKFHGDKPWYQRHVYNFYQKGAVYKLKQKIWKNRSAFQDVPDIDIDLVMKSKTLMEFSDRFSRVLYKHKTVDDYYTSGSCSNFINSDLKTLTLCMNALDDPLVPDISIPREKILANPNIVFLTTNRGGHLGWLTNDGRSWMIDVCMEFIRAVQSERKIVNE